ncbi:phosphoenolpyruvate hydrolase family protein [Sporohalobacter salinus]|uniref:phosphoenolpyruvate hydrolase family protein n=1 Tax=Sporohalobacter salinus TaxID=1494606 RepID=UPI0019607389|nr:phosphoenolpyruvate hydrolase family protein [Sporohalobacter salinus]MBM7623372.1 putative TIM-barrel enzyme [Sporohalobacter salinus]
MATRYTADEIVERLRSEIKDRRPLFMPNCGMGLSGKLQEKGGSDLICVSPTSWWRLRGQGSLAAFLPFSDINELVFEMAREITATVDEVPLISLSGPHNPLLGHREHLKRLWEAGISGINPFISKIYDESFCEQISNIDMGWENEVEIVKVANEMNMFSFAYAFNPEEAEILTEAGADVIASHCGATRGGLKGAKTGLSLEEAAELSQEIFDAAKKVNEDVILFAHGGPIEGPKEVEYIFQHTNAHGFTGGSAAERIPIEESIYNVTKEYKNVPME